MPVLQYMVVPSKNRDGHDYVPLPADFLPRFIAMAKRNGTFKLERNPEYADLRHVSGRHKDGRSLVGTWSAGEALGNNYCVMFHNEADRLPGEEVP